MQSYAIIRCLRASQFKISTQIVSSEISLEMEVLNVCKDSLISMEIETFDKLRPGLNSFHGAIVVNWITTQKVASTCEDRMYVHFL